MMFSTYLLLKLMPKGVLFQMALNKKLTTGTPIFSPCDPV